MTFCEFYKVLDLMLLIYELLNLFKYIRFTKFEVIQFLNKITLQCYNTSL